MISALLCRVLYLHTGSDRACLKAPIVQAERVGEALEIGDLTKGKQEDSGRAPISPRGLGQELCSMRGGEEGTVSWLSPSPEL